jgi:hypothetical protein
MASRPLRFAGFALLGTLLLGTAAADDALAPVVPDPRIAAMVGAVSAQRLKATDDRLVAFGTRNDF